MKDKFITFQQANLHVSGKSACEVCSRRKDMTNPEKYPCNAFNKCGGGLYVKVIKPRPGKHERLLKALLKNGIIGTDGVLTVVLTDSERRELEKIKETMT